MGERGEPQGGPPRNSRDVACASARSPNQRPLPGPIGRCAHDDPRSVPARYIPRLMHVIQKTKLAPVERYRIHVVASVRGEGRGESLRKLGAREVVVGLDFVREPFHGVLDNVGGSALTRAFELVVPGGTLVSIGNASLEPSTIDFEQERSRGGDCRIEVFTVGGAGYGPDLSTWWNWRRSETLIRRSAGAEIGGRRRRPQMHCWSAAFAARSSLTFDTSPSMEDRPLYSCFNAHLQLLGRTCVTRAPDRRDRRGGGFARRALPVADVHIHARFRTESQ